MIFTIPNLISVIRILGVPLFLWVLLAKDDPAAAGWILGAVGATDWVDGWLARRLDQVSELGKMLDPVADRLAIAAAVVGGLVAGVLPPIVGWPLLVREAVVGVAGITLAAMGRRIDVRQMGKAATLGVYVGVANFYVFAGTSAAFFEIVAWTFIVPGLILYYVVAALYAADVRDALSGHSGVSSPASEQE